MGLLAYIFRLLAVFALPMREITSIAGTKIQSFFVGEPNKRYGEIADQASRSGSFAAVGSVAVEIFARREEDIEQATELLAENIRQTRAILYVDHEEITKLKENDVSALILACCFGCSFSVIYLWKTC